MFLECGRPGDLRGFVHKRLLGAVGGFIRGGPLGALGGFVAGGRPRVPTLQPQQVQLGPPPILVRAPARPTIPRTATARPSRLTAAGKEMGKELKFGGDGGGIGGVVGGIAERFRRLAGGGPRRGVEGPTGGDGCILPWRWDPRTQSCKIFAGQQTGVDPTPMGEAVMGRYGAGLQPGNMVIDRAVCLRGMQLGNDGLCYNSGQITNKQRMWPAGRKPLLTGGDMRAISVAARAGRRLEGATKRLQRLGMMKKPARRAAPHHHHPALALPTHHE